MTGPSGGSLKERLERALPIAGIVVGSALFLVGASSFVRFEIAAPEPATARDTAPPPAASASAPPPELGPPLVISYRAVVAPGGSLPEGTACAIRATLRRVPHHRGRRDVELEVTCGDAVLYRTAVGEDVSPRRLFFRLFEEPADDDASYRYSMSYEEQGQRTGPRPQIVLDTLARSARVFRDAIPRFEVVLGVEELSTPVAGLPPRRQAATPPFRGAVSRRGKIVRTTGDAKVSVGDPCALSLRPRYPERDHDARVYLVCKDRAVYGESTSGFVWAKVDSGKVVGARDETKSDVDKDPAIDVDLVKGTVTVEDGDPAPWSVAVALDPP